MLDCLALFLNADLLLFRSWVAVEDVIAIWFEVAIFGLGCLGEEDRLRCSTELWGLIFLSLLETKVPRFPRLLLDRPRSLLRLGERFSDDPRSEFEILLLEVTRGLFGTVSCSSGLLMSAPSLSCGADSFSGLASATFSLAKSPIEGSFGLICETLVSAVASKLNPLD